MVRFSNAARSTNGELESPVSHFTGDTTKRTPSSCNIARPSTPGNVANDSTMPVYNAGRCPL